MWVYLSYVSCGVWGFVGFVWQWRFFYRVLVSFFGFVCVFACVGFGGLSGVFGVGLFVFFCCVDFVWVIFLVCFFGSFGYLFFVLMWFLVAFSLVSFVWLCMVGCFVCCVFVCCCFIVFFVFVFVGYVCSLSDSSAFGC